MISVFPPDEEAIERAAEIILKGGVVVYPTETLYGLGADATSAESVERVIAIKRRGPDMPIPVIAADMTMARRATSTIPPGAAALMEAFWPGPLTLALDAPPALPEKLTAGTGTVGIRIPSSEIARRLAELCGRPITATSANISGQGDPSDPDVIRKELENEPLMLINVGRLKPGPGSTVVDARGASPLIIREGVVPAQRIFDAWKGKAI